MDIQYLLLLQNLREATGGVLNGAFELITKLGEASIVTLLAALVYWCVDKREGIFLMLTFYYNRVINGFLKITACVYRPWIRDPRVLPVPEAMADATGYSFPSGHSANAASFFGGLAYNKKNPRVFPQLPWRAYAAGRDRFYHFGGRAAVCFSQAARLGGGKSG